jgi:very-short-patch-repair endonuclease/predicted transcriptional regulator of viral defense system
LVLLLSGANPGAWRFTRDMDRKSVEHSRAGAIAALAERQHGVIAVAQLYSLGLSETQIRTRAAQGWLHRVHRGVYALGHARLTREGRWMAAVLACGDGAVLSHECAGELWKIRQSRGAASRATPIEVAIPCARGTRSRAGLIVHRLRTLRAGETTTRDGIPVTSPARTILDLASRLPRRQLERAVDEADRLKLCTEDDLDEMVRAHFGRAGAGALATLIREHRAGSTATRNDFEERFLALCRSHHLPQPEVNVPLLDYVVDFLWPQARLVVEVDGRGSHATRRAFQADRDRDGRLAVAGYRVLRFTWWDVTRRPAVVADRIRRMLSSVPL